MARQVYVATTSKGPTEKIDHTVNWSDILAPIDDSIADATFAISGDMTIWESQFTDYDTTLWLADGTAGVKYTATHTITTVEGRTFCRSVRVRCIQR
jgi:hypothetical protein